MNNVSVWRLSGKLFFRLVIGSLICLMLSLSVMVFLNNPGGRMLCQLLNFSAAFSLVYLAVWQVGFSDRNRVKYGYSKEDFTKGFKAGTLATLPFLIPSVLLALSKAGVITGGFLPVFRLLTPVFFPLYYSVFPASQLISEIGILNIAVSFLLPLVFVVIAGTGYFLGYRDTQLTALFRAKR
ncbi:MAG: hypothetical protein ACOYKJ_02715 [Candidatus Howiella sp.]|jgi:hypothetical protein